MRNTTIIYYNKDRSQQALDLFHMLVGEWVTATDTLPKTARIGTNAYWARFEDGAEIRMVYAHDSARGFRWTEAYVPADIEEDLLNTRIKPAGILAPPNSLHFYF